MPRYSKEDQMSTKVTTPTRLRESANREDLCDPHFGDRAPVEQLRAERGQPVCIGRASEACVNPWPEEAAMNMTDPIARLELERQVFRDNIANCRAALRMIREAVEHAPPGSKKEREEPER